MRLLHCPNSGPKGAGYAVLGPASSHVTSGGQHQSKPSYDIEPAAHGVHATDRPSMVPLAEVRVLNAYVPAEHAAHNSTDKADTSAIAA
jgi:hypothetical protein